MLSKEVDKHFKDIIHESNPVLFYMACHYALSQRLRLSKEDREYYWYLREKTGKADPFGDLPEKWSLTHFLGKIGEMFKICLMGALGFAKKTLGLPILWGGLLGVFGYYVILEPIRQDSPSTVTPTVTTTPSSTPTPPPSPTITFTPTLISTPTPTITPTFFPRFVGHESSGTQPLPVWIYSQFDANLENSYLNYLENETIEIMLDGDHYYGSPIYLKSLKRLAFVSDRDISIPGDHAVYFINDTNLPITNKGSHYTDLDLDWQRIRYAADSATLFATLCDRRDICIVNASYRNGPVNRYYAVSDDENITLQRVPQFDAPSYAGEDIIPITMFDWLSDSQIVFTLDDRQHVFVVELADPVAERLPNNLPAEVFRQPRENEIILDIDAIPEYPDAETPQLLLLIKRELATGATEYVFQIHPVDYGWLMVAPLHFSNLPFETPPLQIQWGPYDRFIIFTAFSKTPFTYYGKLGGHLRVDCELSCLFALDTSTGETQYIDLGVGVREFWWSVP